MVIGAFGQPYAAYLARYLAATGKGFDALTGDDCRHISASEFRHDMLQGISRSNLRNGSGGVAGVCRVHLIVPDSIDASNLLEQTFPGCTITPWTPEPPKLSNRAQKVADCLVKVFGDAAVSKIAKKDVRAICGMKYPKDLPEVLAQFPMQAFLLEQGITSKGQHFTRAS
jgi:hypothetical protein